jgi:uncharacterized protein (TIGR02246 family)
MNLNDVIALFDTWNDALATLDPDTVTTLYAEDAVLLPTVSNQVRHNHTEIRLFCELPGEGTTRRDRRI